MGYHYPRSISTAIKSAHYFKRFMKDYSFCVLQEFKQVYGTSMDFSWTNADQFRKFCGDVYPKVLSNYSSTQLDDFTDAVILLTAGYDGEESVMEKAFANYRYVSGDPCESLQTYGTGNTEIKKSNYARYWLGNLFFVKLLLLFFDYPGIRMFNQIMQLFLLVVLVILMEKKELARYIIPFIVSLLWMMPGIIYLYNFQQYIMLF